MEDPNITALKAKLDQTTTFSRQFSQFANDYQKELQKTKNKQIISWSTLFFGILSLFFRNHTDPNYSSLFFSTGMILLGASIYITITYSLTLNKWSNKLQNFKKEKTTLNQKLWGSPQQPILEYVYNEYDNNYTLYLKFEDESEEETSENKEPIYQYVGRTENIEHLFI